MLRPEPPQELTPEQVGALSREDREKRVRGLISYSHALLDWVISDIKAETWRNITAKEQRAIDYLNRITSNDDELNSELSAEDRWLLDNLPYRTVAGVVSLFSGGNDSTTLAHIFKDRATHAAHANTTIGIEQTRQYVRDTCKQWGLPLIERVAPITYRELVLEQGFPGPGHHFKMYQRLKERPLRLVRNAVVKNGRRERVIFLAGRRRTESDRRANIGEIDRVGSIVWVSPLAYWTKLDLATYRSMHTDVPRNEVSDILHMSGECLCGAFAHEGELDEIQEWYPEVAQEIRELEEEVTATGKHPAHRCAWGNRVGKPSKKTGMLCTSCEFTPVPHDEKEPHAHPETS